MSMDFCSFQIANEGRHIEQNYPTYMFITPLPHMVQFVVLIVFTIRKLCTYCAELHCKLKFHQDTICWINAAKTLENYYPPVVP